MQSTNTNKFRGSGFSRIGLRAAFVLLVILVVHPTASGAQQPIEQLLRAGLQLLRDGNYTGALEKFAAATEIRQDAGNAWFLRGVAENRLGRYLDAFSSLKLAAAFDVKAPRLDFEIGWSALKISLFGTAVTHLERFEKAKPGGAKTAEFLGRALTGLRRFDDAEARFREALRRDPGLEPTVRIGLARLARARGDDQGALEHLRTLLKRRKRRSRARSATSSRNRWRAASRGISAPPSLTATTTTCSGCRAATSCRAT